MRRRTASTLAAGLFAGLLTVGCGSSGATDAGSTTTTSAHGDAIDEPTATIAVAEPSEPSDQACDIVSDDVAAEVLGVSVVRREPHGEIGGQTVSCIKGAGRTDEPEDYFFVSVSVIADGATLVDEAGAEPGSEPVAGIGDRATFIAEVGTLFIANGEDLIQVQVQKGSDAGTQQDCVTVAIDVIGRLP